MVVITKRILNEFGRRHADAADALNDWYDSVARADWKNLNDVRRQFNSVDYVGNERFVFNIRGNNYRLVAMIFFDKRTVYIRFIGTHSAYDRIDATTI
jgi:mRNA interferase HigB